jgi:cellulose synthase/poly-beta-1,6-N-acetylglucosamine synthase-like glycosyltransferase
VAFLKTVLEVIAGVSGVLLMSSMIYQMIIGLFGFKKQTRDYADHDPESRFLVLIPAHNEEKVIGDIIRNLEKMDYPRELYDYYVIADNCTDRTAEVARGLGANVIETRKETPDSPTGKPIALRKALLSLGNYQNRYDLMMIFDADNLMDTNMFREVNSQYLDKGKPDFIQCYLGAKNKEGVVAWFYYTGYTLTNRFFDLAKHRLGLNCPIGGTGFAMSTEYLHKRGGWTTMSLTEDFEIQVEATLEGRRILWNHNTRVYDEKPTKLKASIRQKIRWGQGHWFVTLRNTGKLFRYFFTGKIGVGEFVSLLMYMYSVSTIVLSLIQGVATLGVWLMNPAKPLLDFSFSGICFGAAILSYSYFFLFYLADWMDNRIGFKLSTIPVMIGGFFANLIVSVFNQIGGLLRYRDQQHWVKTEHAIAAGTTREIQQAAPLQRKVA